MENGQGSNFLDWGNYISIIMFDTIVQARPQNRRLFVFLSFVMNLPLYTDMLSDDHRSTYTLSIRLRTFLLCVDVYLAENRLVAFSFGIYHTHLFHIL